MGCWRMSRVDEFLELSMCAGVARDTRQLRQTSAWPSLTVRVPRHLLSHPRRCRRFGRSGNATRWPRVLKNSDRNQVDVTPTALKYLVHGFPDKICRRFVCLVIIVMSPLILEGHTNVGNGVRCRRKWYSTMVRRQRAALQNGAGARLGSASKNGCECRFQVDDFRLRAERSTRLSCD